MKIISNTTPLIALASIQELDLLKILFDEIIIPQKVYDEVSVEGKPGYNEVEKCSWIKVLEVNNSIFKHYLMQNLDEGESEVIVLASELKADLVVIDERMARKYATKAGLPLIGTLGILAKAKQASIVSEIRPLIIEMLANNIWFNKKLTNSVLLKINETEID